MMLPDILPGAEIGQLIMTGMCPRHTSLHTVDQPSFPVILFIQLLQTAVDGKPIAGFIQYIGENAPGSKDGHLPMIRGRGVKIFQYINILVVYGRVGTDEGICVTGKYL